MLISTKDQRLYLLAAGGAFESFPTSTALNGAGEDVDSGKTPRGLHQIVEIIGEGAPVGTVFMAWAPTGEIVEANTAGRWPVVTRILRLGGLEERNKNTMERLIYIHGSPVESLLGQPASGGCIRLGSSDVLKLTAAVKVGTLVYITDSSFKDFEFLRSKKSLDAAEIQSLTKPPLPVPTKSIPNAAAQ